MVKHGQIFSADTQAVFYNWKQKPIQRMLDFDYLCGKQSSVCIMKIKAMVTLNGTASADYIPELPLRP